MHKHHEQGKEINKFDFQLEMQVRDYECDIQRIVNDAVD
jgi:acyl-CoA thioesterase FadM